jgi:hypothetical protein
MRPDSRLLIIEGLVEHDYAFGEFFRTWWDIQQLANTLGGARTVAQMQTVMEQSGLRLESLKPTPLLDVLILNARPVPIDFEDRLPQADATTLEYDLAASR